nr:restriction endonuclease subunit S [Snodgrassella sp. ESL0323]
MLPPSWESVTLGEFVENEKGKKPKKQAIEKNAECNLPYIDIEAFEEGKIKSWTNGEGCRICYESDFLMVWDGSRSGLVGKGMYGALGSTLVRINFPNMNNQYAYYFLLSKYQEINTRAKGSGTPHVDPALLWNYQFPIAPFNEQKRIVAKIEELFSELDNGITALKIAREQLKVYRQSVLKHAFEGKLTAKWREDNADKLESPEQLLARIQQEREARYQEQLEDWKAAVKEWEANGKEGKKPGKPKKLIQLTLQSETSNLKLAFLPSGWFHIKLGNLIDEPVYGTSAKCDYETGEQSVLRIPNISAGIIDDTDLKFANFEKGEVDHLRLMIGDILAIRSNGSISLVGSCGLVKKKDTKHIFAGYLIRLRPNKKMIKSEYLLAAMSSHLIRQQIESAAKSTSGVNNINSSELQNLIIPLTSIQEQEVLISLLDSILPMIKSTEIEIDKQLAKAETLRQSILKKAFSGQLVRQDPSDEPASKLLARIQAEKEFVNTQKTSKSNKRHSVSSH